MKVLSFEFTDNWSWGLVIDQLIDKCNLCKISRMMVDSFDKYGFDHADIIFLQQVTLLKWYSKNLHKTIIRLGGNKTFMDSPNRFAREMSQCFAVIATNKYLYDVAKRSNPNTVLIYNGIDLKHWKPKPHKQIGNTFKVGFCGNISNAEYRQYKGYDLLLEATCGMHNVEIVNALFGNKQISHERMMYDYYYNIDCLVHPTLGEGCSNTLMEACACGVPIITTREAGMHGELMRSDTDCIFIERTPESIRRAIERCKARLFIRFLSQNARAFAEKYHDINKIAKQYEELFISCFKHNYKDKIEYINNKIDIRRIEDKLDNIYNIINNIYIYMTKVKPSLNSQINNELDDFIDGPYPWLGTPNTAPNCPTDVNSTKNTVSVNDN